MKNPNHRVPFILIALLAGAVAHAEPGFRYVVGSVVVLDIGTLGGLNAQAYDINDAGHVVGASEFAPGNTLRHAFYFAPNGIRTDIGRLIPNSGRSQALAINASGTVVGWVIQSDMSRAFRWTAAAGAVVLRDGSPADPRAQAEAHAISNSGLIAGFRHSVGVGLPHGATVWTNDFTFLSINGDSPAASSAVGIDDSGLVVGASGGRMRAWQIHPPISTIIDVPTPLFCIDGVHSTRLESVNSARAMVGSAQCLAAGGDRVDRGVFWTEYMDSPIPFGIYPGSSGSNAKDINDTYFTAGSGSGSLRSAFIHHRDFGLHVLPQLTTPGPGTTCEASALNNRNAKSGLIQVVGYCRTATGVTRAVRWDVTILKRLTMPPGPTP
jgi:probable HAF family extracellular repeat protein